MIFKYNEEDEMFLIKVKDFTSKILVRFNIESRLFYVYRGDGKILQTYNNCRVESCKNIEEVALKKDPNSCKVELEQNLFWAVVHDLFAHALMALTLYKVKFILDFHDYTSQKAWKRSNS